MERPIRLHIASVVLALFALAPALAIAATPAAPKTTVQTPKPVMKPGVAPAAPDIGGRWKLDVEHSDFGSATKMKPRERIDLWERDGAEWHVRSSTVKSTGDTLKLDWHCRSDGTPVTNTMMGTPVKTVGAMEGGVLHLVFSASGAFGSILTDERWTLAPDRGTLTLERETKSPMGQYKQRYLFHPV